MSYEDAPTVKDGTYWALKSLYETFNMLIWKQHDKAEEDYRKALDEAQAKWKEKNGKEDYVDEDTLRYEDPDARAAYAEMYTLDNISTEFSDYMRRLGIEV